MRGGSRSGMLYYSGAFGKAKLTGKAKSRKKSFQPWHRPRKQYIRRFHWGKLTEALITKLNLNDRPLQYLTLPGEDMLDIRVFNDVCKKHGIKLKYLAFKEGGLKGDREFDLSASEVSKLSHIHKDSQPILDVFQRLGDEKSKAVDYAKRLGHFDIINLDLCDCITADKTYFDALNLLLDLQISRRAEPWILFLTTRAGPGDGDKIVMSKIWSCVYDNAQKYKKFKDEFKRFWGAGAPRPYNNIEKKADMTKFARMFGIIISKWLLQLMMSDSPVCTVKILEGYQFRIHHIIHPTMISVAFFFEPIIRPRIDSYGLATRAAKVKSKTINREKIACAIISSASSFIDLDLRMQKNTRLNKRMTDETKSLLKAARYDVSDYDSWLSRHLPRLS